MESRIKLQEFIKKNLSQVKGKDLEYIIDEYVKEMDELRDAAIIKTRNFTAGTTTLLGWLGHPDDDPNYVWGEFNFKGVEYYFVKRGRTARVFDSPINRFQFLELPYLLEFKK